MIADVFCEIVKGERQADIVYKDEDVWVMKDIHPQAPVHLLVVPVKHFEKLEDFQDGDKGLLGKLFRVADQVAHEQGLAKGYRLIVNEGEDGGKMVPHVHVHLLGGKHLGPKLVKD